MATPPTIGGYNDRYAMTQAMQNSAAAIQTLDQMLDTVEGMKNSTGRPDYGKLEHLIAQLAVRLAHMQSNLQQMKEIRSTRKGDIYETETTNTKTIPTQRRRKGAA